MLGRYSVHYSVDDSVTATRCRHRRVLLPPDCHRSDRLRRAAAEVSGSQLYHYFADKEGLVQAVIDRQADTIVKNQERADLGTLLALASAP